MGAIAYVADEDMIEYHRLCGNQEINFWRLSSQKTFTDFHVGDLLFFYSRPSYTNKKGFAGYGHYVSSSYMSIKDMWQKYGTRNGYDSLAKFNEAIVTANRDKPLPKKMDSLYLKDVVFFSEYVFPEDIGIELSNKLESYCYLEKYGEDTTLRLLKQAEKVGIDVWSSVWSKESEDIFYKDQIREALSNTYQKIGKLNYSKQDKSKVTKLINAANSEYIKNSKTDSFILKDNKHIIIVLPLVYTTKNRKERIVSIIGRASLYKYYLKQDALPITSISFKILCENETEEIKKLEENLSDERL